MAARTDLPLWRKLAVAGMTFLLLVGLWWIVAGNRDLPDDDASARGPQRCALWFIGSSSIHGWHALDRAMVPWTAHNRGIPGAMLPEIVSRFERSGDDPAPAAIVLYAGENDIDAGTTPTETFRRLVGFVDAKRRLFGAVPVVILSPKPSPARARHWRDFARYDARIRLLADRLPDVVRVEGGRVLMRDGRPGPFWQADGIHLNPAGYAIWSAGVRRALDRAVPADVRARCDPA